MTDNREPRHSALIVFVPLLMVALVFHIVRFPDFLNANRPDLLVLLCIFFTTLRRSWFNVEIAWVAGLLLDLLSGAPLGVHALLFAAQVYLIGSQFRNFASYSLWQQTIIIGVINLLANVIGYWLEHVIGQNVYDAPFVIPALLTAVLWPVVYGLCSMLCAIFSVMPEDAQREL
ncbi:MAG: rod shape-determining protein MreD [Succinivibrio sp.]|nr:rod shape-determining protein MreD [Succinivibrio sp.]